MSPRLDDRDFSQIIRLAPLVAIDLVIRARNGDILLGRRNNEPAKGYLFTLGGVVRKNESLEAAFRRIVHTETGHEALMKDAHLLGVYEHLYDTNRYGDPTYGTHYVVAAYELVLPYSEIRLDDQHCEFRWLSLAELMSSADVHENVKAYFRP